LKNKENENDEFVKNDYVVDESPLFSFSPRLICGAQSIPFFVSMIHLVGRHCLFAISLRAIPLSHKDGVWMVVEGLEVYFSCSLPFAVKE